MDVIAIPFEHDYSGRILREDCLEIANEILKQWNLKMVTGFSPSYGSAEYSVRNVFEKKNPNQNYTVTIHFSICIGNCRKIVYNSFGEYCPMFEEDDEYDTDWLYDQRDYDDLETKWVTLMDAITLPEEA